MPHLLFSLSCKLQRDDDTLDLTHLLALLTAIQKSGNLRLAAHHCGHSYRKGWDTLKQFEQAFGCPLVNMQRGKGSILTEAGQKLLEINQQSQQFLSDRLTIAEDDANAALQTILPSSQNLRIIASDSERLNQLRQNHTGITLQTEGSQQALAAYAEGKCDIAGFHIAVDSLNRNQIKGFTRYLDPEKDGFILLEQRQQGLLSHPDRPVMSLQQVIDQKLLFVNRQQGSGTRVLLDYLLQQQHILPQQLAGYFHEEHTHLAVASMIVSRQADAGLGIETVAKRLKLHFVPVSREYYFLVFKRDSSINQKRVDQLQTEALKEIMDYSAFIKSIAVTEKKQAAS